MLLQCWRLVTLKIIVVWCRCSWPSHDKCWGLARSSSRARRNCSHKGAAVYDWWIITVDRRTKIKTAVGKVCSTTTRWPSSSTVNHWQICLRCNMSFTLSNFVSLSFWRKICLTANSILTSTQINYPLICFLLYCLLRLHVWDFCMYCIRKQLLHFELLTFVLYCASMFVVLKWLYVRGICLSKAFTFARIYKIKHWIFIHSQCWWILYSASFWEIFDMICVIF